ncbi:MAG: hypothetical protein ACTH2Q_08150 [Propionibacteriaceae bacterium]
MRMRSWGTAAATGLLIITLAGCSQSISSEGFDIDNAEETATAALEQLKEDNADALAQKSATLSPDAGCFFVKENPEAEEVSRTMACGPVRRLGVAAENVWDQYAVKLAQTGKSKVTAEVEGVQEPAVAMDTALFVSATGTDPAAADTAPEPTPPPTDVKDKAVLADELTSVDTPLTDLDEPWTLKTPAGIVQVTATADLEVVPAQLLSENGDSGEGDGSEGDGGVNAPPYYAPAEGQHVKAFRVKVTPSDLQAAPGGNDFSNSSEVSLKTQVTLNTDGQKLAITGGSQDQSGNGGEASDTYTISCTQVPCEGQSASEQILLTTTPTDKPMQLAAAVNGETQAINLDDGTLESKVSTVDYERSERGRDVNEQLRAKAAVKAGSDDDRNFDCTFVVDVTKAHLGGFDPDKGWAPAKKAWLAFELDNFDRNSSSYDCGYFQDTDFARDMTLKVGKSTVKATHAGDDKALFEVPADVTEVTFQWTPSGTFKLDDNPKFKAKTAVVKAAFPK